MDRTDISSLMHDLMRAKNSREYISENPHRNLTVIGQRDDYLMPEFSKIICPLIDEKGAFMYYVIMEDIILEALLGRLILYEIPENAPSHLIRAVRHKN